MTDRSPKDKNATKMINNGEKINKHKIERIKTALKSIDFVSQRESQRHEAVSKQSYCN
jgi:hypothetical protein